MIMATLSKPDLLLLDEHTAALDPKSSDTIMNLTQKVVDEKNITTLMVTHNLKHAVTYGDRTIMMHEGKIVMDVKSEEKNKKNTPEKLELNKYCKHCRKTTKHKETKK